MCFEKLRGGTLSRAHRSAFRSFSARCLGHHRRGRKPVQRRRVPPRSFHGQWTFSGTKAQLIARKIPNLPCQYININGQTFILLENLCSTFEAPFMYLLIGKTRMLLIYTGDVAEASKMRSPTRSRMPLSLPGVLVIIVTNPDLPKARRKA